MKSGTRIGRGEPLALLMAVWAFAAPAKADDAPFATRDQAMRYLTVALPKATSENPEYRTKADGTVSRWRTEEISFGDAAPGAVAVTMRESFSQTKDGASISGRHEARFSLADVALSAFTEPGDVTPAGEASCGVLFTCAKPGCVSALWGDKASRADKTDISIQDKATLRRVLAAFRRLQTP